jgi:hypothetical protein
MPGRLAKLINSGGRKKGRLNSNILWICLNWCPTTRTKNKTGTGQNAGAPVAHPLTKTDTVGTIRHPVQVLEKLWQVGCYASLLR